VGFRKGGKNNSSGTVPVRRSGNVERAGRAPWGRKKSVLSQNPAYRVRHRKKPAGRCGAGERRKRRQRQEKRHFPGSERGGNGRCTLREKRGAHACFVTSSRERRSREGGRRRCIFLERRERNLKKKRRSIRKERNVPVRLA